MEIIKYYPYKDQMYTVKGLSEITSVKYNTLWERLRRGYSVEEAIADQPRIPASVSEFVAASDPHDWDGILNDELHSIYYKWCMSNEYQPETHVHFIRCVKQLLPTVRVVPSRIKKFGEATYHRVIRYDDPFHRY